MSSAMKSGRDDIARDMYDCMIEMAIEMNDATKYRYITMVHRDLVICPGLNSGNGIPGSAAMIPVRDSGFR